MLRDRTVAVPQLNPRPPTGVWAAPRYTGPIVAVAADADDAAIQRAINSAAAKRGKRPVIYVPPGTHRIQHTITFPAGSDVRLVGDGIPYVTVLEWAGTGSGPILRFAGANHAVVRDIVLSGRGKADGIVVDGCDKTGGRVYMDQTQAAGATGVGYLVEGVKRASILMRDVGHGDCHIGVKVDGGRALLLSGASSSNDLSYVVENGGSLLARDIWYETNDKPRFMRLSGSGTFTLHNANVAHPRKAGEPGVEINGFHGRASFLGVTFTQVGGDVSLPAVVVRDGGADEQVLALGSHGSGDWFKLESTTAKAARLNSVRYTPGGGAEYVPDTGHMSAAGILAMLAQTRAVLGTERLRNLPAGQMDLRLHRVFLRNPANGIVLRP